MRALKVLKKNGWKKGLSITKVDVERIRISLENSTKDSFRVFDEARRNAWARAGSIVLD